MRISHKYKFVWISKPKTGSMSVRKLLDKFSNVVSESARPFHHHATADELRAAFKERGWNFDEYQVFVCDRNPWELICSIWKYSKVNDKHQKFWEKKYDSTAPLLGFDAFVRAEETWRWLRDHHQIERFAGARPWPANVKVYDIGSQQDLLLSDLAAHIGKPVGELPHRNVSTYEAQDHEAFRVAFSDPQIDAKVRDTFKTSIELFGYRNPFV